METAAEPNSFDQDIRLVAASRGKRVRRIFVSYRRNDTGGHVGRLVDDFRDTLNRDAVFMDVNDILSGDRFKSNLVNEIIRCAVILIVIGPDWLTIPDLKTGARRLDNANDIVRFEVRLALAASQAGARLVPVTVGGARMPSADELPSDIASLADFSAHDLAHDRWKLDVKKLRDAFRDAWWPARSLRGWHEVFTIFKSSVFLVASVLAVASLLRTIAPLYLVTEAYLAILLGLVVVGTGGVIWNGWHPGPRRIRNAAWQLWAPVLMFIPLLWACYCFAKPIAFTSEQDWTTLPNCNTEYYVQPYNGTLKHWQPTREGSPNRPRCDIWFSGTYQQVRLITRFGPTSGTLQISTANEGRIEALFVPSNYRKDVNVDLAPGVSDGGLPPPPETLTLTLKDSSVDFVCGFKVESDHDSVRTVVSVWSPFGWKAAEEIHDVNVNTERRGSMAPVSRIR